MATLADLLTMYGGTGNRAGMTDNILFKGDGTDDNAQAIFDLAKKYDPNAKIGQAGELLFDRSKLPQQGFMSTLAKYDQGGGKGGNFWDKNRMLGADGKTVGGADVLNPAMVTKGGDYGNFVDKRGMAQEQGDKQVGFMGQLEKYMPAVVSAIMAAGMGAGAGPMLGGLMSGTIGPGGVANKLSMGEDVDWKKVGTNAAMGVAGGYLPGLMGGNGAELMKWLQRARQGYGIYNSINGRG